LKPGDVVIGGFPGANTTKIRPAVVLSTEVYHQHRPDVILGLITTRSTRDSAPTDCELREWQVAGLRQPSIFRLFLVTLLQREVRVIGRLSDSDWTSVRSCCKAGLGNFEAASGVMERRDLR
jgi:mRNA interferase MazF